MKNVFTHMMSLTGQWNLFVNSTHILSLTGQLNFES